MKRGLLFSFCFLILHVAGAQSLLRPGMIVVSNYPVDTAFDYAIHVYDTRNVITAASPGINWSMNTLLPGNSAFASQWKYARMGMIFGVTIDNAGNIFAAAGYGAYNNFPGVGTAGWGGIYKIDAMDWSVSDFITTDNAAVSSSTTEIPNTGYGLGNITYDKWHDQLFVTNFEDGKIYRISMNGMILNTFDPFLPGDTTNAPAPNGDRPWGIAVYQDDAGNSRLYFSNWSQDENSNSTQAPNTIWSVSLNQSGDFSGSEQLEITLPVVTLPIVGQLGFSHPVSCINFSSNGKMLLAERSMHILGVADSHASRYLEYINQGGIWSLNHIYEVGNTGWYDGASTNSSGGADFGYADSDPSDSLNGCEQLIWGTGDGLRASLYNPDSVHDYVYGITGIPESGNSIVQSSNNFVCSTSYYIDMDNANDVPKTAIGSCAVFRNCQFDPCENYSCSMINVLTPNEDGVNDKFRIDCVQSDGWKLEVYNRWGNKVYSSDNYQNNWDCAGLVEGVYYYLLTTPCGEGKTFNGFFHLLR